VFNVILFHHRHGFPIIYRSQEDEGEKNGSEIQVLLIWQSSLRKKTNPDPLPQKQLPAS